MFCNEKLLCKIVCTMNAKKEAMSVNEKEEKSKQDIKIKYWKKTMRYSLAVSEDDRKKKKIVQQANVKKEKKDCYF